MTKPSGSTWYLWDLRNRMAGISLDNDGTSTDAGETTYTYDHAGVRTAVANCYALTIDSGNFAVGAIGVTLSPGMAVRLHANGGTLPAGLVEGQVYYLVLDGGLLRLASTLGGGAISLTDTGGGPQGFDCAGVTSSRHTPRPRVRSR